MELSPISEEQQLIVELVKTGVNVFIDAVAGSGKTTTSFKALDPIERGKSSHLYGVDYWNAYEFNYLDDKRLPVLKVLQISIPSSSVYTVESKSLKLYLNAFYKKSYSSDLDVLDKITKDLNPEYGSIQKLYGRDTDLLAFCEDKVVKILANIFFLVIH